MRGISEQIGARAVSVEGLVQVGVPVNLVNLLILRAYSLSAGFKVALASVHRQQSQQCRQRVRQACLAAVSASGRGGTWGHTGDGQAHGTYGTCVFSMVILGEWVACGVVLIMAAQRMGACLAQQASVRSSTDTAWRRLRSCARAAV